MMWSDFYLKAPDKATFEAALPEGGFGPDVVLDVVGDLSRPAVTDPETGVETPGTTVAGWHVNVRCRVVLPEVLAAFMVPVPSYPKRKWA